MTPERLLYQAQITDGAVCIKEIDSHIFVRFLPCYSFSCDLVVSAPQCILLWTLRQLRGWLHISTIGKFAKQKSALSLWVKFHPPSRLKAYTAVAPVRCTAVNFTLVEEIGFACWFCVDTDRI